MRKIYSIPLMAIFAIALVSAVAVYYNVFSATFNVTPAITVGGILTQQLEDVGGGETIVGSEITLTNNGDSAMEVLITNDADESPNNGDVEVSYVGTLELTKKNPTTWAIEGDKMPITYTIVGDTIEVTGVEEGYTLIYYKDKDTSLSDIDRLTVLGKSAVLSENMPHANDWNAGELADYCTNEFDNYKHCRGAKLWAVPDENIVNGSITIIEDEPSGIPCSGSKSNVTTSESILLS